jgi:hypothetical protein
MPVRELRIVLPLSLEEYRAGYAYTRNKFRAIAPASRSTTNLVQATPYSRATGAELPPATGIDDTTGVFTHHRHEFKDFLPSWALAVVGSPAVAVEGRAWDEYPDISMRYDLPSLGIASGTISLSFKHVDNDRGTTANAFNLRADQLRDRRAVSVDICADPLLAEEGLVGDPAADPSVFVSRPLPVSGRPADFTDATAAACVPRGPLTFGWRAAASPVMCVYVLLSVDLHLPFPLTALRARADDFIMGHLVRTLTEMHRLAVVWVDEWYPHPQLAAPAHAPLPTEAAAVDSGSRASSGSENGESEDAARRRAYATDIGVGAGRGVPRAPSRPGGVPEAAPATAGATAGVGAGADAGRGRLSRGLAGVRTRLQARL